MRSCLDVLAPSITHVVNLSYRHVYVPDDWETAIVKPLLKKSGLELTYENFRPVSNLPFISKIVEIGVLSQFFSTVKVILLCRVYNQGSEDFTQLKPPCLINVQSDSYVNGPSGNYASCAT